MREYPLEAGALGPHDLSVDRPSHVSLVLYVADDRPVDLYALSPALLERLQYIEHGLLYYMREKLSYLATLSALCAALAISNPRLSTSR